MPGRAGEGPLRIEPGDRARGALEASGKWQALGGILRIQASLLRSNVKQQRFHGKKRSGVRGFGPEMLGIEELSNRH
jgi:hypothetical protein